jgi:hypothetical protein
MSTPRRVAGARSIFTFVACATMILFPGCSQVVSSGSTTELSAQFEEQLRSAIATATSDGASEAQLDLLERARHNGQVSVELVRQAQRAVASCASAAGVRVTFTETTRPDGWVSAVTQVDASATDADQIYQRCEARESLQIARLYDTQPTAVKATSDYLDQQAPILRACLQSAGLNPKPNASGMDLARLAVSASADESGHEKGMACLHQLGVDGF